LAPQHILAVHRCLHRALAQAVTWRLVAANVATDATPPPVPTAEVVTLTPQQVAVLLDAGTVRFRQALTIIDPAVLPDATDPGGRRKELAVGPVKSAASSAMLTLPPFAVQALRHHRRQQARLRLACGQPQTATLRRVEPGRPPQPVQLDLVFRTERVRAAAGGPVDAVLDVAGKTPVEDLISLAPEPSKVASIANFAAGQAGARVTGGSTDSHPMQALAQVAELLAQNKLVIKVQTFPFDRAAEAYRISQSGHVRGNLPSSPEAPRA
jgi:hypothetical protein